MSEAPTIDPIARRFAAAVREVYGDRVERIVLYGSRARGDHRPDSDYDIAVFMHEPRSSREERDRLLEVQARLLMEEDSDVSLVELRAGSYVDRTLFMHEVRKDGIDL